MVPSLLKLPARKTISNDFECNSMNAIELISRANCNKQYVVSAADFSKNISEYTKVILTPKEAVKGVSRHFTNKCKVPQNPNSFKEKQPIEQVIYMTCAV